MKNAKCCIPQELLDIIFMELDFSSIEKSRSLQSDYVKKCTEYSTITEAAKNGNLHCVKFHHINRNKGCTTSAMDWAVYNGHLDVVKWLHENRKEGCTTYAMDYAAKNGHLDVVKWLHLKRTEGCTTNAIDRAA